VSAVEWLLGILTLVAVLMVFYSFVVAPWLDEHDRRTRAEAAERQRLHDEAWAAIDAKVKAQNEWFDINKRGPR
jgi:hypothetical protein